ncbi:MAG TPA: acyl-CoA desaturase [Kofleriaceae bacterium]|nr:acyl-CoA desaturase [Kofleriaceae bacterium]
MRAHRVGNLRPALQAAGVYERAQGYHVLWFAGTLALYAGCFAVLLGQPSIGVRLLAIVGLAVGVMQFGLFAHEVGHGAVTRSAIWREALGQLSNSLLIGFGFSHWQATHPVHHNHPNTEGMDPDMESRGYALYESATSRNHGFVARFQPVTMLLGFLLWGFAIRVVAVVHAIRHVRADRKAAIDLVCIAGHVGMWVGLGLAFGALEAMVVNYCAITMLNGVYMGAILVVPHVGTGTRTTQDELPYFERQVVFSRNYDASALGTLLCGGLNLQIEHHLLPGIPCVRLRRARPIILAYCEEHGLPYRQVGYWAAWREVIHHGQKLAKLAREHAAQPTVPYQEAA